MRYSLPDLARRAGKRRSFTLPPISSTRAQADDLAAIYMQAVAAWKAAVAGPLLQAYTAALTTTDAVAFRDDAAQARSTIDGVSEAINRLLLTLTPALRQWAFTIDRVHKSRWVAGALSAAGVDLTTIIGPQDAAVPLETAIARNVELVRNVSDQTRGRIADIVFRGLSKRTPAREVAREMNEAVGLGRDRSLRIASDQATKLSAALDAERQRAAGLDEWIWRWSRKKNGRAVHAARDGKRYTDATAPDDLPGELPYCGCRRQAYISLD